ncbi:Vegetative incompatibility protein [Paramyrothecium foliicola]|nr:Vegetative incompatibility protein [Paramyrothecium foliicola]
MSLNDPAQNAFIEAQKAFRRKIQNPRLYDEILTITTANEVYKATSKLQEDNAAKGRLRHLVKIKPFLDRLGEYATVIEVFVQVQPEILALIWGPIKILLLWSSEATKGLDCITDALASIGNVLPHFEILAQTFDNSDAIRAALALFYEDMLDFYQVSIEFFKKKRWPLFFDSIWPNHRAKIEIIISNLKQHSSIIKNEVTLLDIVQAKQHRDQTYEHFKNQNKSQMQQKFVGLRSRVSPLTYDERLEWFRNRSVTGCEKWLYRNSDFSEWFDVSTKTPNWLWFQGIPGAGKTYLTAAAIDHIKEQHKVLFVFLTYTNQNPSTALSVIQSLIFQIAEDDSLPFGLTRGERARSSREHQLCHGVDEMDELERGILLGRLDEFANDCEDLRILISSRAEDDISKILEQKARTLRIHNVNAPGIQTYVNTRSQHWIDNQTDDDHVRSELLRLVLPLSVRANGMFLFARIVLDDLERMSNMNDIFSELKAMPHDLKDAYHRIFNRINGLKPRYRALCRKVLGYIGCAPAPLTVREMEQAICINVNPNNPETKLPDSMVKTNFVRLCGPIIEVIGDELRFVHFTVQEYIFSPDIPNRISRSRATEDLAMLLLAYLSSDDLDLDLDEEDLTANILGGKYRLFEYASFHWLNLIHQLNRECELHSLTVQLNRLISKCRNHNFRSRTAEMTLQLKNQQNIGRFDPQLSDMLRAIIIFFTDEYRWDWNWSNSDAWVNFDPLLTSQFLVQIQERFDDLVTNPVARPSLERHYGSLLYRCNYPFCPLNRQGFEGSHERLAHLKNHGKPWKCRMPTCDFATIGFSSKTTQNQHWMKHHLLDVTQLESSLEEFETMDAVEAQAILLTFVDADDVVNVKRLLLASSGKKLKSIVIATARGEAAKRGSLEMTQLLTPEDEVHAPFDIIKSALRTEDAAFAQWAISKVDPGDSMRVMHVALKTPSEEIFALWEEHVVNLREENVSKRALKNPLAPFFKQSLFTAI